MSNEISDEFKAWARDHSPELVLSHYVHGGLHGGHLIGRFNAVVAALVGRVLSSMWFFWGCVVLVLIELPPVIAAHSLVLWVTYVAQTVIQLLALPALGAMANLQQAVADARAEADHATLTAIKAINDHQTEILELLRGKASE